MLFNSIEYLIFLPTVFLIYWVIFNRSVKSQNIVLLLSSYFFYGWWDFRLLSLIVFSTMINYWAGKKIFHNCDHTVKKVYLYFSLFANLGVLAIFKYFNFFLESINDLLLISGNSLYFNPINIILPVGISFYTFQTMSYTIDIYRSKIKPERKIINFAVFVSMFPQLVAGPIERASNLLPQIAVKRKFDFKQFKIGILQIFVGLTKKMLIIYKNKILMYS